MAEELNAHLEFASDEDLHINDYYFLSSITNKKLEL